MHRETGEIRERSKISENEIKNWIEISEQKEKTLTEHEKNTKKVNLGRRSPLANEARNKRKKRKKMSQKSRVKNRKK